MSYPSTFFAQLLPISDDDKTLIKDWCSLYSRDKYSEDAKRTFRGAVPNTQVAMLLCILENAPDKPKADAVADYMLHVNEAKETLLRSRWQMHRLPEISSPRSRLPTQQQQPATPGAPIPQPRVPDVPQPGGFRSPHHTPTLPPGSYPQPPPTNTQWSRGQQHPQPHLSQLLPPPGHQQAHIQSSQSIAPPGNTQPGRGYVHQSSGERPSQTSHTTPRAGTHPPMGVAGVGQEIRSIQGQGSRVPGSATSAGGPAPAPEPSQTTGPKRPNFRLPATLHQERLNVAARVGNAQRQVMLNWEETLADAKAQMAAKQEQLASLGEKLNEAQMSLDQAKNDARIAPRAQELRLQAGHHRGEAESSQETFAERKKQGDHTFHDYKHVSQSAKHMSTANAKDKLAAQVPTPNIEANQSVIEARRKRDKAKAEYDAQKQLIDGDGSVQAIRNKLGREKRVYDQAQDCYGYESQTRFMQRESDNAWAGPVQQALDEWYSTNWERLRSSA